MKVRKNLSIDDMLLKKAENKALKLGFNFSSYITYLINKDISGEIEVKTNEKNDKVSNAISNILD